MGVGGAEVVVGGVALFFGLVTALGEGWEGMEATEGPGCWRLEEDMFEGVGRGGKGSGVLHFGIILCTLTMEPFSMTSSFLRSWMPLAALWESNAPPRH